MDGTGTRCRACLLRDTLSVEAYARIVMRARQALDGRLLAPGDVYEARLDACRACDQLQNGTCMLCGCLVEVRALRKDLHCPTPRKRW